MGISCLVSGPVSPSQPVKPDQPVRRIMKRSDSSSTAGDDVASVKSLESGSGEPSRESEKRPPTGPPDKSVKSGTTEEQTKESTVETRRLDSNRVESKQVDDQDMPVFEETGSFRSGDTRQRRQSDSDRPRLSESNKENVVSKERVYDKVERKDSRDSTPRHVPEKNAQTRDRREERRNSKRDMRPQDDRRNEDSKDAGKRKRDDNEDGGRFPDRRGRFAGRGDTKRERFSESRGRGSRASYPVRGHGRGIGGTVTSYRGRGRGERGERGGRDRDNRDIREYKDYRSSRAREPRPSPPVKTVKDEQKQKEEDKENVVVKENASIIANENVEKVHEDAIKVKQEKELESSSSQAERIVEEPQKRVEETIIDEKKKDQEDSLIHGSKVGEDEDMSSKLPDKDAEKPKEQDDLRKKSDSYREANNLKPKGRGGFGRPGQYSQDSRNPGNQDRRQGGRKFTDKRRTTQESGKDRNVDYDDKRPAQNYSRDQTSQRATGRDNRYWERGREKESQKSHFQHDDRDNGNRRYSQDDRKKRISEKGDDQQPSRQRADEKNQRGGYRSHSTRGRFGKPPVRTSVRGGRSSQPVGSGRFGNNYRRSRSTDEELSDDDYDSDSSSYTTATSASEERKDDKPSDVDKESDSTKAKESGTTFDKSRASSRSTRSPIRGKVSSRAGGRGAGGFGRSRREVERPPRFQKQQERERASMARGLSHGVRPNEGRESGPGRGRGRGRGRREQLPKDSPEAPGIPVTEDWDQEIGDTQKESGDKPGGRRESAPRRGFSAPRSSTDRTRKDKNREPGGTRNTSSRREPFLVERQQAKVEGSKSASGEPRAPLPAARNGFSKDGNRRSDMQGHVYSTGLDSINTGVPENKVPRKQEPPVRKTDIQQFDLHNIAGVICIDDMTDDDSDISSTLSGFVEVTSRRTQKENKDRQRDEEEKRKKIDEQNRQRGNQVGNKKNQPSKPPRFSKQHTPQATQANTQSKLPGVIGKVSSTALSEASIGPSITGSNSNPSSANSTKRNSPVTVERPVSPPPPPVFNAWDKPLIVIPAKPPSTTPLVTSSIPDPLAVGSGKPSSTRPVQPVSPDISLSFAACVVYTCTFGNVICN